MRILTLKQFIQQAGAPQEVLAMPVREFLNERVSPDAPTEDHREPRITQFSWSMAELKEDLRNWSDNYTVDITMNSSEPGKIWMVFQKGPDGCED